jgi:phage terminase small subunit
MVRRATPKNETVEQDDDLAEFLPPPARGAARGGGSRTRASGDTDTDETLDGGAGLAAPELDGFANENRKSQELQTQLAAKTRGKPVFPYPPELPEKHRPYWLELVNSFPADHFQNSDIPTMKLYCRCAADIERTTAMIEEEGEVVMGGRGPMINPRVRVRSDAQSTLLAIATKFRNQPASRTNTENFANRQNKAKTAAGAAQTVNDDEDGLLAGGTQTRH